MRVAVREEDWVVSAARRVRRRRGGIVVVGLPCYGGTVG